MTENNQRDPLADLFSNVQLTGLSKPKSTTNQLAPLQIDVPDSVSDRSPPKTETGLKKPKRPPRFTGEPYESRASDIEVEEVDSEDENDVVVEESQKNLESELQSTEDVSQGEVPTETEESPAPSKTQTDVQAKLRLVMLQQKMQRQRMALKKKQEAEQAKVSTPSTPSDTNTTSSVQNNTPVVPSANVKDSLAKLNSKLTQKDVAPSAMDLFLAAAAESENPEPKAPKKVQKPAVTPPQSSTPSQKSIETPVQPVVTENKVAAKPLMGNRLMLKIEDMIRTNLPLLKEFHVASALDSFDRPLMKAIWRSHRSKFLMHGQLEYAVSALSVIDGLEKIEEGQLVAAYVETMASDYLIWIDIPNQHLVAAFADAKSYFANQ